MTLGIYLWKDLYVIHASVRDDIGLSCIAEPVRIVKKAELPSQLGLEFRSVLQSVPSFPSNDESNPVLKAFGERSWGRIDRESLYCSVEANNTTLQIIPSVRNKPEGGHDFLPAHSILVDLKATNEALGLSVLEAFRKCS
ncbi:hypothetical protein Pan181_14680 [Aeoliella mucimassa]|uniref:Uncharacterized protein n=1 Tax=Aeoliella mucimassa TaxID=2527972 RepID=A0A518AKM9_9BACT|nr:hypothetical protein Pan181_14680 [Aeoliella mucimassa]